MSVDDQAVQGHDLQQELRDALAPELLLLERIGQGGMGDVFLARDPVLKRNVAVKVLARHLGESAEARQRFLREAEAAAAVAHPNVVPIYRIGALPKSKLAYIVMAHVEGHSLRELFPEGSVASESEVRQVMAQVASALSAAHARGVVHRDIKPANVLQDPLGGRWVVVDFGIAALEGPASPTGARLTAEGRPIGTPAYMSPEQAAGDPVGPKSDVYSLGCLAFELLTGRPPFSGPTPVSVVAGHLQKPPPSVGGLRSDLSTELALLVMRCLLKDPDQRPSAAEVARALGAVQRAAIEWPPPGLESLHRNGVKWVRSAGLFAVTLLLFVLILGVHPSAARPCCTGTPDRSPGWLILKQLSMLTPIRFDDPDALAIWYFLLDAAFFVLLAGLLPLIWRTAELGRLLVSGRRNGYPFRVLGRVAWDRHRDTASLINLTGRYGLLAPERQRLLLRRRTRAAELQGLAILLLIGGCLLWLAGVLSLGLPADQGLLPLSELLLITGPAAIAFVAFLVLAAIDLGASRRYRPSGGRRAAIRRDVLEGWIRTSGHRVEGEAGSDNQFMVKLSADQTNELDLSLFDLLLVAYSDQLARMAERRVDIEASLLGEESNSTAATTTETVTTTASTSATAAVTGTASVSETAAATDNTAAVTDTAAVTTTAATTDTAAAAAPAPTDTPAAVAAEATQAAEPTPAAAAPAAAAGGSNLPLIGGVAVVIIAVAFFLLRRRQG